LILIIIDILFILQLFAKGKLKVKGNVMLAQKLSTLFKEQSKL
jgi:putative sterol carrier protein